MPCHSSHHPRLHKQRSICSSLGLGTDRPPCLGNAHLAGPFRRRINPQEKGSSPRKGLRWVLGPGPTHHSPCNPESETNARVPIPTSPIWSWGIVGIGLQKHGQDDQTTSREDGRVLRVVFGVVSDGWQAGGWQGGPTMFGGSVSKVGGRGREPRSETRRECEGCHGRCGG